MAKTAAAVVSQEAIDRSNSRKRQSIMSSGAVPPNMTPPLFPGGLKQGGPAAGAESVTSESVETPFSPPPSAPFSLPHTSASVGVGVGAGVVARGRVTLLALGAATKLPLIPELKLELVMILAR